MVARAGIPVTPAIKVFAARHPDVLVDVQRIEWDDQAAMLLDGRIDVGYVRLPDFDEAGLRVVPLYTEPRVAVLPAGHRLAGKDQVTEADLAGEPLGMPTPARSPPGARTLTPGTWCGGGRDARACRGPPRHLVPGPFGDRVHLTSGDQLRAHPGPGAYQVCLAVSASRSSPVVDDFFAAAQATAETTAECGNYEMWEKQDVDAALRSTGGTSAPR